MLPAQWATTDTAELSRLTFFQLCRGEVPVIRVPGVADTEECARLVEAAEALGFSAYQNVVPRIDRIGVTAFEFHARGDKQGYFRAAEYARTLQSAIFEQSFDPVARVMGLLREHVGVAVEVADEEDGVYYAGLIRRIEKGTMLHIDYAPAEQPGWSISDVSHQLSWNLCCRVDPASPGATHIYDRQWQPADEQHRVGATYGFRDEIVAGAREAVIEPSVGDLYLLNTRNYHRVRPCEGQRVTTSSACGVYLDSGAVVVWS